MTEIHELQLTVAKLGAALQDHQNKIEVMRVVLKNLAVNRMAYVHKRTRRWMRWIYCAPEKKRPQ
jgi:hypothetical protein